MPGPSVGSLRAIPLLMVDVIAAWSIGCGGTTLLGDGAGEDRWDVVDTGGEEGTRPDVGEDTPPTDVPEIDLPDGDVPATDGWSPDAIDDASSGDVGDVDGEDGTAGPACPGNLAGRLESAWDGYFAWNEGGTDYPVSLGDRAVFTFAIIPFPLGATYFCVRGHCSYYDDPFQQYPCSVFRDGLVDGLVPYEPGAWNIVEYSVDLLAFEYDITVNGVTAHGTVSDRARIVDSIAGFTITAHDAGRAVDAWIDGISLVHRRGDVTHLVLAQNFEDSPIFPELETCGIVVVPPDLPLADPMACEEW
jgi:hypothetical protein